MSDLARLVFERHSGQMPAAVTEPVFLDATLRPSVPLKPSVLKLVVSIVGAIYLVFGLVLVWRGAWLVTPFMGADVALLAWAFSVSLRASRRSERVTVTPSRLVVERRQPGGAPSFVALNPYWVRLEMSDAADHWSQLTLWSHGQAVRVGGFLAPVERLALARDLKDALRRAQEIPS